MSSATQKAAFRFADGRSQTLRTVESTGRAASGLSVMSSHLRVSPTTTGGVAAIGGGSSPVPVRAPSRTIAWSSRKVSRFRSVVRQCSRPRASRSRSASERSAARSISTSGVSSGAGSVEALSLPFEKRRTGCSSAVTPEVPISMPTSMVFGSAVALRYLQIPIPDPGVVRFTLGAAAVPGAGDLEHRRPHGDRHRDRRGGRAPRGVRRRQGVDRGRGRVDLDAGPRHLPHLLVDREQRRTRDAPGQRRRAARGHGPRRCSERRDDGGGLWIGRGTAAGRRQEGGRREQRETWDRADGHGVAPLSSRVRWVRRVRRGPRRRLHGQCPPGPSQALATAGECPSGIPCISTRGGRRPATR